MGKGPTMQHKKDDVNIARVVNCDIEELFQHQKIKQNDLKIICQNIRMVYTKINDLNVTLSLFSFCPDIIILYECRLTGKTNPIIPGCDSYMTTNHLNQNYGVVAYVKNTLNSN